jgi:hypothetical protein
MSSHQHHTLAWCRCSVLSFCFTFSPRLGVGESKRTYKIINARLTQKGIKIIALNVKRTRIAKEKKITAPLSFAIRPHQ